LDCGRDQGQPYGISGDLAPQTVPTDADIVAIAEPPRCGQGNAVAGHRRRSHDVLRRLDEELSRFLAQVGDRTIVGEPGQHDMTGRTAHAQGKILGGIDVALLSDFDRQDNAHKRSVHFTASGFGGDPGGTTSRSRTSR